MKKILIANASNAFNYGSAIICENFIRYLSEISKHSYVILVDSRTTHDFNRYALATELKNISPVQLLPPNNIQIKNILRILSLRSKFSYVDKDTRAIIVTGGDDFTEYYGSFSPLVYALVLILLKMKNPKLKLIMFGQTIGPFKVYTKVIMKYFLKRVVDRVYAREPLTFSYLTGLGLKNVELVDDLGLLPHYKQKNIALVKDEYICFFPSELIYRYSKYLNREIWIEFNLKLLEILAENYPKKKTVIIPHVLSPPESDDRKLSYELYQKINPKYKESIVLVTRTMLPYEVRDDYISRSHFIVTSRMHPAISALSLGIPPIAFSYSEKYLGIISNRYGLGNFLIDVRKEPPEKMKEHFMYCLKKIESEKPELSKKIWDITLEAQYNLIKKLKELYLFLNV